jgi:hypothetical protein
MKKNNDTQGQEGKHEHPLSSEISDRDRKQAADAHREADHDMDQDAELTAHSPNDDLDEGETARLGEDKTDLV